jgi:hypothetical protein
MSENYSGGWGGGASCMKVQACVDFVPNANVISSSLRSSQYLTYTSNAVRNDLRCGVIVALTDNMGQKCNEPVAVYLLESVGRVSL